MIRGPFLQLTIAQATMLRRNTSLWVISIFLAVLSMTVFGLLFRPDSRPFDLAIADEDGSARSQALVAAFEGLENVEVSRRPLEKEMSRFEDGELGAVLVIPAGFAQQLAQGRASLQVFFDSSDLVRAGYVQSTVAAVIDQFNRELDPAASGVVLESRGQDTARGRFIDFLTPGMVGMTLMWTNIAVGYMLISWREQGILRRLGVTPLRPGTLIGSQAASFAFISVVQAAIILAIGRLAFNVTIEGSYIYLAVTVLLGVLAMLSIGYVIASFLRTVTAANAVGQLVAFPMMFLSKSYFPLDEPPFLTPLVNALPLTYLNDALRDVVNRGNGLSELQTDWLVLAAWAVAGFFLSVRLFRWQ